MDRIQITHDDISDPERLRQRLDGAYAQNAHLLTRIAALEGRTAAVESKQGTGLLTPTDQTLLSQLAVGGTASAAAPTPGLFTYVVNTFADLPPPATVLNGSTAWVLATNIKYGFNGLTRTWVAW